MTRNEIITLILLGALVLLLLAMWGVDRRRRKRGEHRAVSGVIGAFDEVFHPEAARALEIREVQRELPAEMPTPDSNATTHVIEIHFAYPMTPRTRHEHEDGIAERVLPQLGASGRIVGGGTALTADGEPESSDIVLEITTGRLAEVVDRLAEVLERNGISRGSWIEVDGFRRAIGRDEYVLLRTRFGDHEIPELPELATALQHALLDGELGWHDETYPGHDGPVFVFSGPSADRVLAELRTEMRRHARLADAELVPVAPGRQGEGSD